MEDKNRHLWVGTQDDGSYVFDFEKKQIDHFNYRLMTKDIDYHTFQREKKSSGNISDTKQSIMNNMLCQKIWLIISKHTKTQIYTSDIQMKIMYQHSTKTIKA